MKANTKALIKLASTPYDMYDHESYARRHDAHNPEHKVQQVWTHETSDTGNEIKVPSNARDMTVSPREQGMNTMSRDIYPGQYNILSDRPNIEGTGHGMPLGRRPQNPHSYT